MQLIDYEPQQKPRRAAASSLRDDAATLHAAVSDLVRAYQFRDRDKICCYDVSVTQCHALEILVEQGALRSLDLAAFLRLDKSTVTRVIDALVRKGYVERQKDTEDSRARSLCVTSSGRALYEKINGELIDQQVELLADLKPETRAAAANVIRQLARAAKKRFDADAGCGDTSGTGCRAEAGCC